MNELAEETGESLTEAALRAFEERLTRLRSERAAQRKRALQSLHDLIEEARAQRPLDERPLKVITDELWGETDVERA
ncbi:MAG: type II toxin-antitoxin system VapB family antitoxin [Myxococcota bacterium]